MTANRTLCRQSSPMDSKVRKILLAVLCGRWRGHFAAACTRLPSEINGPGVPFHIEELAFPWNFESSSLKSSERGSAHPAF